MIFKPTPTGGRLAEGQTPFGDYRVVFDRMGNVIESSCVVREPIPAAYDPDKSADSPKRGSCCDPPAS